MAEQPEGRQFKEPRFKDPQSKEQRAGEQQLNELRAKEPHAEGQLAKESRAEEPRLIGQQARRRGDVGRLSLQECEFLQRWRGLIDEVGGAGGKVRVARRLKWSTSTVSRDYAGETLPSDTRLDELSDYLRLAKNQRIELAVLLQRARDARRDRRNALSAVCASVPDTAAVPTYEMPLGQEPGRVRWRPGGRWIAIAVVCVALVVAGVTVGVFVWQSGNGAPAGDSGIASYPGEGLEVDAIPVASLSPSLAAAFRRGRSGGGVGTVTGYEFRNAEDQKLCLTAVDTGPAAGRNGDRVEIAACRLAASQVWIPEQWEINGSTFTHLVSAEYQSMCLNANNVGGLAKGRRVQLWDCYPADNESWDFGDWYRNVKGGVHSYPIFLDDDHFCLDADKFDFGAGDSVVIWSQYSTANQFWS